MFENMDLVNESAMNGITQIIIPSTSCNTLLYAEVYPLPLFSTGITSFMNDPLIRTLCNFHDLQQEYFDPQGDPEEVDVSVHLRGSHCLEPPISDTGKTCYAYFPRSISVIIMLD